MYRQAIVSESRFAGLEAAPVELGRAMLSRVVTRMGLLPRRSGFRLPSPTEAELELTIDDGANEPLDLRGVSVVLAELPWIYFEAPAGAVTARYWRPDAAGLSYDLEAVRSSIDLAKVPEAKWGDGGTTRTSRSGRAPRPRLRQSAGAVLDPDAFRYSRAARSPRRKPGTTSVVSCALPLDAHALAHSRGPGASVRRCAVARSAPISRFPTSLERRNEPLSIDLPVTARVRT